MIDQPWGYGIIPQDKPWGLQENQGQQPLVTNQLSPMNPTGIEPPPGVNMGVGIDTGMPDMNQIIPADPLGIESPVSINSGIGIMPGVSGTEPLDTNPFPEPGAPQFETGISIPCQPEGQYSHEFAQDDAGMPDIEMNRPPKDHTSATDKLYKNEKFRSDEYFNPSFDYQEPSGIQEHNENKRMWSDRDYPFGVNPRGKGAKGGKAKSLYLQRVKPLKGFALRKNKRVQSCPECGFYMVSGYCDACKKRYLCFLCLQPMTDGKCTNRDCPLCKDSNKKCPECGEDMPCGCGFE